MELQKKLQLLAWNAREEGYEPGHENVFTIKLTDLINKYGMERVHNEIKLCSYFKYCIEAYLPTIAHIADDDDNLLQIASDIITPYVFSNDICERETALSAVSYIEKFPGKRELLEKALKFEKNVWLIEYINSLIAEYLCTQLANLWNVEVTKGRTKGRTKGSKG